MNTLDALIIDPFWECDTYTVWPVVLADVLFSPVAMEECSYQRGKHEHHTRLHSMYYLTHTVECSMFDFERAVFEREKYWSTL